MNRTCREASNCPEDLKNIVNQIDPIIILSIKRINFLFKFNGISSMVDHRLVCKTNPSEFRKSQS
jgi:hypothetical protein